MMCFVNLYLTISTLVFQWNVAANSLDERSSRRAIFNPMGLLDSLLQSNTHFLLRGQDTGFMYFKLVNGIELVI